MMRSTRQLRAEDLGRNQWGGLAFSTDVSLTAPPTHSCPVSLAHSSASGREHVHPSQATGEVGTAQPQSQPEHPGSQQMVRQRRRQPHSQVLVFSTVRRRSSQAHRVILRVRKQKAMSVVLRVWSVGQQQQHRLVRQIRRPQQTRCIRHWK